MSLKSSLTTEVGNTFTGGQWDEQVAYTIPQPTDLRLNSNHSKHLKSAAVLYADIDGSTGMVDKFRWWFSAEVYKAYLRCASQIIRNEGGTITAYDGDRVMGVFSGDHYAHHAVVAAMKINYSVHEIIRPAISHRYPTAQFVLRHVIGVDASELHAARVGVHGDNDIVWVGRAANYAAKLCSEGEFPVWITKSVFDQLPNSTRYSQDKLMWQARRWSAMSDLEIYGTTYYWHLA